MAKKGTTFRKKIIQKNTMKSEEYENWSDWEGIINIGPYMHDT